MLNRRGFWRLAFDALLLVGANALYAMSIILFLEPANLAPGGVIGMAIIIREFITLPTGLLLLLLSVPITVVGYFMLDRWHLVISSALSMVLLTALIEALRPMLPAAGVSTDDMLNAIFAGLVNGFAIGLIFRTGANPGGTTILTRILQRWFGLPMSTAVLYIDGVVIVAAGVVLGWEAALYAFITLLVTGALADYALEGPSVIRTAMVITQHGDELATAINQVLHVGVTEWEARGHYTGEVRAVLFVTVGRAQVDVLRRLVFEMDPAAYVVIGVGHRAYRASQRPAGQVVENGSG
jgi:uncharacterized membrane-anchored protein YitT (DUF2179 family)